MSEREEYVVETIGELGACACERRAIGDVFPQPSGDWWQDFKDGLKSGLVLPFPLLWPVVPGPLLPPAPTHDLPSPSAPSVGPDPIPPALDLAGPAGWGELVVPGLLTLAAIGAVGFVLTRKKRSHATRRT